MGRNERTRTNLLIPTLMAGAVLLVGTGCGGASESESSEPATSESAAGSDASPSSGADITSDIVAVTSNRIGDQHGERLGFAVTAVALDSGYSLEQLVESPTPSADGSIEGVQPAGPPLGVLSAPAEPSGFRRSATPDETPVGDFRVTVLSTTLEGIYDKAFPIADPQAELDARTAAAREGYTEADYDILFAVLMVVGRGYTLEQTMEAFFFGTIESDAFGCLRVEDEPPRGQKIAGAMPFCPKLEPEGDQTVSTDATADTTPVSDAPIAAGETDPDRPRGVYQATLEDISALLGADSSSIISNLVSIDLDGDVPEVALLWVAELTGSYDRSPDVICVIEARIEIERAPLAGATLVDGQWTGEATLSSGSFDGTCSAGSQENQPETGPITVTFTATETTVTGTLSANGDALSFSGAAVS